MSFWSIAGINREIKQENDDLKFIIIIIIIKLWARKIIIYKTIAVTTKRRQIFQKI